MSITAKIPFSRTLELTDSDVFQAIANETSRQASQLELIASENFVSEAVLEAMGSVFTNKYAEGYPGKRYYGGFEYIVDVWDLVIQRAKAVFSVDHLNVQPHSCNPDKPAVYIS